MRTIVIPYKPRNWAKNLHAAITRWIVLVLHRRAGKTTAAFNHLQRDAMRYRGTRYAYIAPTFKQAKRIIWAMAKHYAQTIPGVQFNSSELLITYPNGSEIMILGSDNPDALRGIALWGAFLDEYPLQSPIIFTEIVTKCLADHKGYCIFGGTPKGKGHFYKVFEAAGKYPEDYTLVYKTIDQSLEEEGGTIIENLRQALEDDRKLVEQGLMTEDEFQQEWYCSFEAAIRGAIYLDQITQARKSGRFKVFEYEESHPVYTVWDLGISKGNQMAIGFFQKIAGELRLIDYYENVGLGISHYIRVVQKKKYIYGKHFAPHDIKKRSLETGKTLLDSAAKLGLEFEVVPSLSVEEGIDLCRAMWSHFWINIGVVPGQEKTQTTNPGELFLDLIGQYHYKFDEERRVYTKVPHHDFTSNAADMLRYAAIIEDEMSLEELPVEPVDRREVIDDEYVGQEDPEGDDREGYGKHPVLRNVRIGDMGHKK